MIIILFGLAASGKNFVGSILENNFGFNYFDADDWLNGEMKKRLKQKQHFSPEMLDNFTNTIIKNTKILALNFPKLVISQALYRQKNREQILNSLQEFSPKFIEVVADNHITKQRIIKRNNWVSVEYALEMEPYFQKMAKVDEIYNNQGVEAIMQQLTSILDC